MFRLGKKFSIENFVVKPFKQNVIKVHNADTEKASISLWTNTEIKIKNNIITNSCINLDTKYINVSICWVVVNTILELNTTNTGKNAVS